MAHDNKKRPERPTQPDPPLEPLAASIVRLGCPVEIRMLDIKGDPGIELREFICLIEPLDLSAQSVGTATHLAHPYVAIARVSKVVSVLAQKVTELGEAPTGRVNAAAVNVTIACNMLFCALSLHLQQHKSSCLGSIALARTALEATALALLISDGGGSEVRQWEQNQLANVKKKDLFSRADTFVESARAVTSSPTTAYKWMCQYAHVEFHAILDYYQKTSGDLHSRSYAAIAYGATFLGLVAERVTGIEGLALWPLAWPHDLPWGHEMVRSEPSLVAVDP